MNELTSKNSQIIVKNLDKEFSIPRSLQPLEIFKDISFDIDKGNIVSIIGPSGCGKTTLLRIMAGLIPASSGSVFIDNIQVKKPSPDKILVFQDLHLFNWMTVYKNVEFAFLAQKIKPLYSNPAIKEILQLVGLNGFEQYYPQELSGGMRQRLALARALGARPSLMFLDEPFSSLDMATKIDLETEYLNLAINKNITTVLVTHDIRQAIYLSNKIIVLTKRPATVKKIINVDFSFPRNSTLWESEKFYAFEILLSKMLKN